jgi:prepilin-type N-terminal cleavage/methylation domain-containing protein
MTILRRIRARLAEEAGFTLTELLTAATIGSVVVFAAFGLVDRAFTATNVVQDRVDAAQRGRIAMDDVTRQLGSQVCFSGTLPLISGSPTSITFVTDFSDGSAKPERHTLSFVASGSTFDLQETDYTMTSANGATPVVWSATATRTKTLVSGVTQDGSTPFFRYFGYDAAAASKTSTLNSTLTADDLDNVTQIGVSFSVRPAHASTSNSRGSTLSERVAVPLADPNLTDPNKTTVTATC